MSNVMSAAETASALDEFDLLLLEAMVLHPEMSYKEIAGMLRVDQRTVAKRIARLTSEGILRRIVEVDWSRLGLQAEALVGTTTARGIDYAHKLNDLIQNDPRIVEAYETLGPYHHFMRVIESDTFKIRDSVIRDLDLLAAELTTTLITKKVKEDYRSLIRYLRETRYPRSRAKGSMIR